MGEKVVVITGASAGIGATLAKHLGAQGMHLALLARREQELNEVAAQSGSNALPIVADVTRRADIEHALEMAIKHFGRIDAWVNNAGRGINKPVSELSDEDVDEMMLVNLKSALYGMQAVLPHFKERGTGQIINVSSMLGRMPLIAAGSAYSASKHALNALTGSLRLELHASHPGIVISSVHPGVVATEFGIKTLHGGLDSRQIPGAQSAEEVAAVIADVLEHPRADVYTRPEGQGMVVAYYAAEDMAEAEGKPPFFTSRP
jgi:NADP-dependent 3-hydroxy acid dehydrogenase YdfG